MNPDGVVTLHAALSDPGRPAPARPSLLDGPQLFARYAFMPNRLTYCGGDDNRALFDYCMAGVTDPGLHGLLKKFAGAMPYLRLIASCNAIADPFDRRVVEAYWLGNQLLEGVEARALYDSLRARFARQLKADQLDLVLGKAPAGAHPHHSFHVLEVCPRNGWPQACSFMDNCRVSWGRVIGLNGATLTTEVKPLVLTGNNLALGDPEHRQITRQIDGCGFVDAVQPGDWISIHWGWACQVLNRQQVANLERWTQHHLTIANQTL
jgi:hydrogenase maturation factor